MKTALIIIDVQNDFLPGGSLAVPNGDVIIPFINNLENDGINFDSIVATYDWHPKNHISFASTHKKEVGDVIDIGNEQKQILWPDHCVQNTLGAAPPESLNIRKDMIWFKGSDPRIDSYSAFFDSDKTNLGLDKLLKEQNITKLFFVGLATEYCVFYSVSDAIDLGFDVKVYSEGICGIDSETVNNTLNFFKDLGILI